VIRSASAAQLQLPLVQISCTRFSCRLSVSACCARQSVALGEEPHGICAACDTGKAVALSAGITVTPKFSRDKRAGLVGAAASRKTCNGRDRRGSVWSPQWTGPR
jgi:hypothetical protein